MKPIFFIDKRDERDVAQEVAFYEMNNGDVFIDASDVVTVEFSCQFTIKNEDLLNLATMFKQIADKHCDKGGRQSVPDLIADNKIAKWFIQEV